MKKFLLLLITLLIIDTGIFASDKLPVKVTLLNTINTSHDEIEVGDIIPFEVVRDVYYNEKVIIPNGTIIYGTVDYVSENGWCFDNAQIELKTFEIAYYPEGKRVKFQSELTIDGFDTLKYYYPKWKRFFQYIGTAFRGKEVYITPDYKIVFNIWYSVK